MRSLALALLVVCAACPGGGGSSGGGSGGGGGGAGGSSGAACDDYAEAICTRGETCNQAFFQLTLGSQGLCRARWKQLCELALTAPGTGARAANLGGCANAIRAASCQSLAVNDVPGCVAPGQRANGAGCLYDAQCQSTFCKLALETGQGARCGTCAALSQPADDCSTTTCSRGFVCARGRCLKPVAENGSCADELPCELGLGCVGVATFRCLKQGATVGAPCESNRGTKPDCAVDQGLWCNDAVGTCQKLTYLAPDAGCGQPGAICTAGGECEKDASGTGARCNAPALEAEACRTLARQATVSHSTPQCLFPAACSAGADGVCVLPTATNCQ